MPSDLAVIIDDSATSRKILERLIASIGGVVARTFADAEAALAFCRKCRPGLVVVGESSGGRPAADFVRSLQAVAADDDIPVLVVASAENRAAVDTAREAGAADHLLEPIDHREFYIRARQLLVRRNAGRRLREELASHRADSGDRHRDEQQVLSRVIDALPTMVCVTGADGRYLMVNRGFAALVGVKPERLVGKRPNEAHDDRVAQFIMDGDAELLAGAVPPGGIAEETVMRHGAPCVLLVARATVFSGADRSPLLLTVLLDATERRREERHLSESQADAADRRRTEFLYNMSHELRTPLNAIIGFSQVIASEMLGPVGTPKYAGYARDILDSAERLLGIVNDILDVSRLEAGTLELTEETIDVAGTVADLLKLVEERARAAGVRLEFAHEGLIPQLRADARKLRQIVINLLTNAVKFSQPRSVVEVVLRNAGGAVVIVVADRGIGMDSQEVELAMTRFGQVATPWARKHDGTGLGLPLAIGLAELHGASLTIHSAKGVGTTVTVAFPRERSEPMPADRPAASAGLARGSA